MKKSTIIVLVVVLIAAAVYFYMSGGTAPSDDSLQAQTNPEVEARAARVLTLLTQIKSLKIDASLFSSPEYTTLRDYSVAIPPQDVGRLNPFAPLPGVPASPPAGTSPRR